MSLGGDFYAMTDTQLDQILDGQMDFFDFYQLSAADGGPIALFTQGEDAWDVLNGFFHSVAILGTHETYDIPEMAFYSHAEQVKSIAAQLASWTRQDLKTRFEQEDFQQGEYYHGESWLDEPDELFDVIEQLIAFYQDCAQKGHALLYRMT